MKDQRPDQPEQKTAVILGNPAFEQLRKKRAAERHSRKLAIAASRMAVRKRLVTRMLNRERGKPHLRVIK